MSTQANQEIKITANRSKSKPISEYLISFDGLFSLRTGDKLPIQSDRLKYFCRVFQIDNKLYCSGNLSSKGGS